MGPRSLGEIDSRSCTNSVAGASERMRLTRHENIKDKHQHEAIERERKLSSAVTLSRRSRCSDSTSVPMASGDYLCQPLGAFPLRRLQAAHSLRGSGRVSVGSH